MFNSSQAIIAGAVREHPVSIHHNPHDAKRWRTPAGNEISLVSRSGQSVLATSGEGEANIVCVQIESGGAIEAGILCLNCGAI